MPSPKPRIVIDASIARAAGDASMHPVSKNCREILQAIDNGKIIIITANELTEEWKKHQSRYFKTWLVSMVAKRRFEYISESIRDDIFRTCITSNAENQKCADAMEKDAHLIEIALQAGKRVVALDEIVRALFKEMSNHHHPVKEIMWANPTQENDSTHEWALKGAPIEKSRKFGYTPKTPQEGKTTHTRKSK